MKRFAPCLLVLLVALAATDANARAVRLKGKKADDFIAKNFPNASIPGPVSGAFQYKNARGRHRAGHAKCNVPAMGARSDGEVSTCAVHY